MKPWNSMKTLDWDKKRLEKIGDTCSQKKALIWRLFEMSDWTPLIVH